jgi:hypothetical protein
MPSSVHISLAMVLGKFSYPSFSSMVFFWKLLA